MDPATFAHALTDLMDRNLDQDTRLHVLSLSDFHQAVGDKWDRLQGLIEIAADTIVCKHIDLNHDIFTRLDAETSCLALPHQSRQQAKTCVAAIAQDLAAHLFGDTVMDGRRPQVLSADMAARAAVDPDGNLDNPAIHRAVAAAALAAPHRATLDTLLAPAAVARTPPPPIFAISGGRGDGAPPADGPAWQPVLRPRRPEPPPVVAETPDWLRTQLEQTAGAALARPGRMAPETSLSLAWTPVWVTNRQAIGAFQAQVIRVDGADTPPLRGAAAYAGAAPIEALTLDRFVATQAASELKNLSINQQRTGLAVPFHWMSLAPRWRDCVRLPFEDCPPAARRKLLKIEIFGLSPDIPPAILHGLFDSLEKLGCDVMARLPLAAMDMIPLLRNVRAVGLDLAEMTEDELTGDDQLLAQLVRFRAAAQQAKKACYVWGLRRRPLMVRAVRAGFSLVNGPALMPDITRPALASAGKQAA